MQISTNLQKICKLVERGDSLLSMSHECIGACAHEMQDPVHLAVEAHEHHHHHHAIACIGNLCVRGACDHPEHRFLAAQEQMLQQLAAGEELDEFGKPRKKRKATGVRPTDTTSLRVLASTS